VPPLRQPAKPAEAPRAIRTFEDLIACHDGNVTVAVDTEFKGPHTLTVQFAARLGDDVVVQVYSSPAIPGQPDAEQLLPLLPPGVETPGRRVVIREGRRIPGDLAPACVLDHLFGLRGVEVLPRISVDGPEVDGELTVTFVAHFWRADFLRIFGREFFEALREHQLRGGRLVVQDRRLMAFRECGRPGSAPPVLGYAGTRQGESLYAIRVRYFDTCCAFGQGARLDDLARTFAGVGKLEGFGQAEKSDMLETFRRQPGRAYAYAVTDSVLTLLVKEGMESTHRAMYRDLGFTDAPPLRSTQGSRVAELIVRAVARAAAGSTTLSGRRGKGSSGGGAASLAKVKALLAKGSGCVFADEHLSQFGDQTGQTHGGLCFSRSPTVLFHAAPGMLADVDLAGCYARVMGSMSLYAGRPVVHEPGRDGEPGGVRMTLKEALAFVTEHAAGRDAWVIKVSGQVSAGPNVLIPSTKGALTNANYRSRAARRRAAAQWARAAGQAARQRFALDRADEARKDTANTAIYTDVIEAGVVAWPIWLMIQALPEAWRDEYETLEVDTVIFYPAAMVADTGAEFDALVQKYHHEGTPWTATIDMAGLRQVVEWRIADDHVALRYDLGRLARSLQQRREEAKAGNDKAAERGYKEMVNSLYGVMASRHLPTNNVVAANVTTATARALAFAMHMSLNGIQVITDGCTYRRDQVPAGTFADCLAACPDYTLNRGGFSGPFVDPAAIPADGGFSEWYRGHVKRFFGVSGPDYDQLFGLHTLVHKACGDTGVAFDALGCDGSANYIKLLGGAEGWEPAGPLKEAFKARSFGGEAKEAVAGWLIRTYSSDSYRGPPPITESASLLAFKEAGQVARRALAVLDLDRMMWWHDVQQEPPEVYYPLGLKRREVKTYKVIKPSAFLFRTPRQQAAFARAMTKFAQASCCGLELLALRKSSAVRRRGSIADVAATIHDLIRSGKPTPTMTLNLNRACQELEAVRAGRYQAVQDLKDAALIELIQEIDARAMEKEARLTGLFIRLEDIYRVT
jgi:hypothetical protein